MHDILYNSPRGDDQRNPSDVFIESLLGKGERYWQDMRGRGHGAFDFLEGGESKTNLEVMFKRGFGFYFEHTERGEKAFRRHLSVDENPARTGIATCHYGGQPFLVPAALFIPRHSAEQVVKEFCRTGKMSDYVKWFPRQELGWDSTTGSWHSPFAEEPPIPDEPEGN